MWLIVAVAIETMTLAGVAGTLITRRTFIAFLAGFNSMALVAGIFAWQSGLGPRAWLVFGMVAVYLLRMNWVLIFWTGNTALSKLNERSAVWEKLLLPVVLTNTVGWAYCLPLYFALRNGAPLGLADLAAATVYVVGTAFHFGGDYQKHRFKTVEGNRGKLLDTGFWSLCRHPNYFGDFLIYASFAILGGAVWGWVAPALNLLQYAFDAIPKNEKWAAERYGAAWTTYKQRVRAFVPFLI